MPKLTGHWIAKRIGIVKHYKTMTVGEIILFDVYLLLANKETCECWRTIRQLVEILPMNKRTIIRSKKKLIDRGWIKKIGRSGIFISKLFRFHSDTKVTNEEQSKVTNEEQQNTKVTNEEHESDKWGTEGDKWGTSIEEDLIIEETIHSSPKEKLNIPFREIIKYLNKKTGKTFKWTTKATKSHIQARWNEGYKLEDFKQVIDCKCSKWLPNPEMVDFLRPQTLFGPKFEGYLNEQGGNPQHIDPEKQKQFNQWKEEREIKHGRIDPNFEKSPF